MRTILWVAQIPRASMAAQAAWQKNTRHTVASVFVQAAQHSSNGRPICAAHKFPQEEEQVSPRAGGATSRRHRRWATSLQLSSDGAHARTTQDPIRVCHGSLLPAALAPRRSNTHQSLHSTLTVSDDIIGHRRRCQLAECCENVGGPRDRESPYRYRVLKTSFHKSVQLPRPPGPLRVGLLGAR